MHNTTGPQSAFSESLHSMKYRQPGETFRDAINRISFALADSGDHYHRLRPILMDMRFMPAGRVQAAIGSGKEVTAHNCFVSGIIPDSYVNADNEQKSSIMHRALEAAQTMRMGGGIGYDFSTLRPRGAMIQKLQSSSSGPMSFMEIFNAVCKATSSSGHRRGAQMGVLRIDHPDVLEFINSKHGEGRLDGFNISVAVTDEFMNAVSRGTPFALKFEGRTYKEIDARDTWETLMRSTWDWADPGVLFIDVINRMNNLWYCERITATNPCGEQPLPPHGACLLGSFNLVRYLSLNQGSGNNYKPAFDWDRLSADIPDVVRGMDMVTDKSRYPLPQQRLEATNKRRMGLGVTALANCAETLGFPYGSRAFLEFEDRVIAHITRGCYMAGAALAKEKGAFPLYDEERYLAGQFIQTLDDEVHHAIRTSGGSRCSHYSSIAPTGTISMSADNVSSSIEPVFDLETQRPVNTPDGPIIATLKDYAYDRFGVRGRLASEVSAREHVAVLTTAARRVDSAVSKTCNVDGRMPWDEFKGIYWSAWEGGAKGCTTFNANGKKMALLTGKTGAEPASPTQPEDGGYDVVPVLGLGDTCEIDPASGRRSCE